MHISLAQDPQFLPVIQHKNLWWGVGVSGFETHSTSLFLAVSSHTQESGCSLEKMQEKQENNTVFQKPVARIQNRYMTWPKCIYVRSRGISHEG